MSRRRLGPPAPPPTRDEQVERQRAIIVQAQRVLALLLRLPEWAIHRTAARTWLCATCRKWIERRELHVEDRRDAPDARYFIRSSNTRLCLECAPQTLATARRIVRVGDQEGDTP